MSMLNVDASNATNKAEAMNRDVGNHDPYHVQPHVMSPRYDHLTTDPDSPSRLRKTRLAVRSSAPRTFDDTKPQRPTGDNRSDGKGYCPPTRNLQRR